MSLPPHELFKVKVWLGLQGIKFDPDQPRDGLMPLDIDNIKRLQDAVCSLTGENKRLRAALKEIAAITILPVEGYQKRAVMIARRALNSDTLG